MPYKDRSVYTGIYKIQSTIHPERCYIGSAVNIRRRWLNHKWNLSHNSHRNPLLQRHYNKYGADDLQYSIVAICDKEELRPIDGIIRPEQFFIWAYDPFFNINKTAGSRMGAVLSEETREKCRQSHLGKKRPAEVIAKRRGLKLSKETRKKMSEAKKGFRHSDESRKKMSEARKGNTSGGFSKGHVPWNKGKKTGPQSKKLVKRRIASIRKAWELKKELNNV
jgi:group I intron endonuclease